MPGGLADALCPLSAENVFESNVFDAEISDGL